MELEGLPFVLGRVGHLKTARFSEILFKVDLFAIYLGGEIITQRMRPHPLSEYDRGRLLPILLAADVGNTLGQVVDKCDRCWQFVQCREIQRDLILDLIFANIFVLIIVQLGLCVVVEIVAITIIIFAGKIGVIVEPPALCHAYVSTGLFVGVVCFVSVVNVVIDVNTVADSKLAYIYRCAVGEAQLLEVEGAICSVNRGNKGLHLAGIIQSDRELILLRIIVFDFKFDIVFRKVMVAKRI